MHTIKSIFLGVILCVIPVIAFTQNSTNSPYTRYGYGILADKAFISQRGMGGIGYGLRNSQFINPMNPATYSNADSMTFMFDFGISGQSTWLKDGLNNEKDRRTNGNLEYVAMQFLLAKKLGFGAGIEPVSYVGYSYMDTASMKEGALSQAISSGSGGFSKVYGALSYDFFDRISVGAKIAYLFGDISHNLVSSNNIGYSYSFNYLTTMRASGILYDFGVQYHQQIGKFKYLTIGAVYTPKTSYRVTVQNDTISNDPTTGTYSNKTVISRDSVFEMPASYGIGFTYNQLGKLTIGADVLYQRWSNAKFFDQANTFNNRLKYNVGGELIPNRTGGSLFNRIRYRAGAFYSNSYLKVEDSKYNEYGVNIGLGIPMPDRRTEQHSLINVAFEYSRVKPEISAHVYEQYFKISLSYTFSESWFFKRKLQ